MYQVLTVEGDDLTQKDAHFVPKGWGYEVWFHNSPLYCGKLLHLDAGKRLSFHHHKKKTETLTVVLGVIRFLFSWGDDLAVAREVILHPGQSFQVPPGLNHQLIAVGGPAEVFEASTEHFDEDSYRVVKGD